MSGYQIFRDGTKIGEGPGIHGGFTNTWNDTGRTCGTAYDYAVAGVDTTGTVGPKSTLRVTTSACDPATPPPPPPTATTPPPPPPPTTGSTAPTAPPNLRTTSVTQTAVSLAWDSSTDPDGMSGYQIFRDGTKIGEGPATNTWNDTGRTCGTTYDYAVAGVDTTGTVGPKSTTLRVTTSACDPATPPPPPPADTTAPSKPANVTAGTRTATSIALSWQPSDDDVGVVGYGMYRGGTRVGTSTATTWIFSGLTCGTNYTLAVDAADAANNRSAQSVLMVSTTACSDTQAPTAPTNLNASNVNQTGLTLTWSASSDSVGVTGYDVYRNNTKVATVERHLGGAVRPHLRHHLCVRGLGLRRGRKPLRPKPELNASTAGVLANPTPASAAMTGDPLAGCQRSYSQLKSIGYGFGVTTVAPGDVPGRSRSPMPPKRRHQAHHRSRHCSSVHIPAVRADTLMATWTISTAGSIRPQLPQESRVGHRRRSSASTSRTGSGPGTGSPSSCGVSPPRSLRNLRTQIQAIWPGAKIYHDIGWPSDWAPGGDLYNAYSCIGNKYADQTGVADYVGV